MQQAPVPANISWRHSEHG